MSVSDGWPHALVFDSGLGGLSIASTLMKAQPHWAYSYVADTAFFPYGTKSDAALLARLPVLLPRLCARLSALAAAEGGPPIDRVVIACNTASTLALQAIRGVLSELAAPGVAAIPVVGVVPAIKPAAQITRTGVIGVLATPGTVRRSYTDALIADFAAYCHVIRHGSATLVELAERAALGETFPASAYREALQPMFSAPRGQEIDVVVLACTHFPLVAGALVANAPPGVRFVDSSDAVARQTAKVRPTPIPEGATATQGDWRRAIIIGTAADAARQKPAFANFGYHHISALAAEIAD
jgi:glutamate racemase